MTEGPLKGRRISLSLSVGSILRFETICFFGVSRYFLCVTYVTNVLYVTDVVFRIVYLHNVVETLTYCIEYRLIQKKEACVQYSYSPRIHINAKFKSTSRAIAGPKPNTA
jgi:hypothetical protein